MPTFVGTASEGLKVLYGRVATDAMHDSKDEYDRPKCHPATCKAIIDEIIDWVENDNLNYPFLWMNGPVGSGKSTIARTIAKILTSTEPHEGSFAASFFFRKTVPGRNNPTRLVATIAYQLTRHVPKVKKHIAVALEKEPFVFDQSYEDQMAKLVMGPLIRLADRSRIPLLPDFEALLDLIAELFMQLINHPSAQDYSAGKRRRLVIIDGLDECGGLDSQVKILKLLFMAVQKAKFPLFFLIVSRPEHGIRTFFNEDRVNLLSRRLILDNEQYKLDDDIRSFLLSEFKNIRIEHPSGPSLPQIWPLESDVQQLVQKASGQFIYADTVMKFIKSHKTRPTTQLELILGMTPPDKSFTVLDDLYIRIFESAFGADFVDNAKRALEVFSFLILRETGNILTIEDVEKFLGYEDGDVQILFNDLHSVVNVPLAGSDFSESAIHIYHTSLRDFLLDKNRAKGFFIDAIKSHALLAKQCIRHLSNSFDSESKLLLFLVFAKAQVTCEAGFDTDNNILKISYFDLQHHHSVLFASRQSANSDLHAFDLGAYPNLAHHKDSVDLASHRFCLLLPFRDHIRYEIENNQ
ncbi:hypothetical protein CPB84DRAFT_792515 [Gymnopilus junonius]|uniref:Nephrocystin 3-like N-terminal domain-containing protein n=1 Tax=Gymnopilus junonius TaxID=109634 RepID=A0A9P5N831_GYMJU|nr:hypothetical protein CPB84DRAFT_792515 [Gymnopilus junonius]